MRVLDLRTLSWSSREAREEGGGTLAAVSGAAAVVAPNRAAYVFGGARTSVVDVRRVLDSQSAIDPTPGRTFRARCLDLTEDPGRARGTAVAEPMDWIDATAESSGPGPCPRAHLHRDPRGRRRVRVRRYSNPRRRRSGAGVRQDETLGDLWALDGAEGAWRWWTETGPAVESWEARA